MELESVENDIELVNHLKALEKKKQNLEQKLRKDRKMNVEENVEESSTIISKPFGDTVEPCFGTSYSAKNNSYFRKRKYVSRSCNICSSPIASFLSPSPFFEPRHCSFHFGIPLSLYLSDPNG
jgi:hypothetical protein